MYASVMAREAATVRKLRPTGRPTRFVVGRYQSPFIGAEVRHSSSASLASW